MTYEVQRSAISRIPWLARLLSPLGFVILPRFSIELEGKRGNELSRPPRKTQKTDAEVVLFKSDSLINAVHSY